MRYSVRTLQAYYDDIDAKNKKTGACNPLKATRQLKCTATLKLLMNITAIRDDKTVLESYKSFSIAELDALLEQHPWRARLFPDKLNSKARQAAEKALGADFSKLLNAYNDAKADHNSANTVVVDIINSMLSFTAKKLSPTPEYHHHLVE